MQFRQSLQGQLEHLLSRRPSLRLALIAVLILLVVVVGRIESKLTGTVTGRGGVETLTGFAKVIDGDSLRVAGGEVRLKGIDAPEGQQSCRRGNEDWPCGDVSRTTLQQLIGGRQVVCESDERDKHDRHLGRCSADGRSLNAAMVESGMAVSYGAYMDEQREAQKARRGLWSGEFQQPRDWRRERGIGQ